MLMFVIRFAASQSSVYPNVVTRLVELFTQDLTLFLNCGSVGNQTCNLMVSSPTGEWIYI